VSGCVANQGRFYGGFDAVVVLSVPPDVLLAWINGRVTNDFGKHPADRARILEDLRTVEPLLRKTATAEIDAARPLEEVIDAVETIAHRLHAGPRPH